MATVPVFRIDADVHCESMVLLRPRNAETRHQHLPRLKERCDGELVRKMWNSLVECRVSHKEIVVMHDRMRSMSPRKKSLAVVVLTWLVFCFRTSGSELKPATAQAFEEYAQTAETRMQNEVNDPGHFLQIDGLPDAQKAAVILRLRSGEVVIQPITTTEHESPVQVPGGLVHHWFAIAFIPSVTARQVLQLSQDYSRYGELYKPDVQYAKILNRDGDHFRVTYRFYRHTIVSVVYDTEFEIDYCIPDSSKNYSLARSIRIAELQDPGKPSEREYPVGKDHGYMWRLNLDSRWIERDGGVYLQVEFLALSRRVPAVFAWLVNPYMRSIPREYLTRYMDATRTALSGQ